MLIPPGLQADDLHVSNGSFESPTTEFADPRLDAWQKSPEPEWYTGGEQFPWDQLMGQFRNTPAGSTNHIDNVVGEQAAFLFALPEVALFQDAATPLPSDGPAQPLLPLFEVGRSYSLTVAVAGGGGGMSNGVPLELSLYYLDAASQRVAVAARTITNSSDLFPTNTHLLDFQVRTPVVRPEDPWSGHPIGIRISSTVGFDLQGGYWDLDHVRLVSSAVPNPSFESPTVAFADPGMDSWRKSEEPVWYTGGAQFPWEQLMGQFRNTPYGTEDHITNLDGDQAAFLFALPEVALSIDNLTSGGKSQTLTFAPGTAYSLDVALLGGGGGMSNGVTLELSLYYRDDAGAPIKVAATTVTNTPELFPVRTSFVDFRLEIPAVVSTDPWAGKPLGIQLASTVSFELQGGYWDVDNVRLGVKAPPKVTAPVIYQDQVQFTLESPPGILEVLTTSTLGQPSPEWTSLATLSNSTGRLRFTDTHGPQGQAFYQVRRLTSE